MAVQPVLDPGPSGAVVSPMAAAVFTAMLRRILRHRISPATGIDPDNATELWAAFQELERVGEEWKRAHRRISVVSRPVTEMHAGLSADMEIDTEQVAELLNRTTSRVRQLLRFGELPGRKVGRRWVVRRGDVITHCAAHRNAHRKAAA
jgi:excisionase family DNA binding protein